MAIEKKTLSTILGVNGYRGAHAEISKAVDVAKTDFTPENLANLKKVVEEANALVLREVGAHGIRDLIACDYEQFDVRVYKDTKTGLVKSKDDVSIIPVHAIIYDKMDSVQKSRIYEAMRQAIGYVRRSELKEEEEEAFSKTRVKSAMQTLVDQLFPDAGLLVKSTHVNSIISKVSSAKNKQSKFANSEKTFVKIIMPVLASIVLDEPIAQIVPKWDK